MGQTAAQWAFSAVTGYTIPDSAFSSAAVDGWLGMTRVELIEEIEGQVDFYLPKENFISIDVDVEAVADAIITYKSSGDQSTGYEIYISLVRYAVADETNGILKEEGVFNSEEEAVSVREKLVAEGILLEKGDQEITGFTDEEIEDRVRGFISVVEI